MIQASASGRIKVLDGLRGIAILLVMVRHAIDDMSLATRLDYVVHQLGRLGSNGVDVFFVLSGFLITGILLDTRGRSDFFPRFYLRRTVRIFPIYYLTLAVLFVMVPRLMDPSSLSFLHEAHHNQAWYWAYMTNWLFASRGYYVGLAHFWSLAVEEQFYLVWPLVVLAAGPRRMLTVSLLTVALTVLARVGFAAAGFSTLAIYVMSITRLDGLAVGSLLAVLARTPGGLARFQKWYAPLACSATLLLIALVVAEWGQGRTMVLMLAGTLIVAAASGAALALSVVAPPTHVLVRVLSNRVLRFFGKYSYGLYILHPIIYTGIRSACPDESLPAVAGSLLPGRIVFAAVAMALSVIAALLSWHLWEKHWLRLKGG